MIDRSILHVAGPRGSGKTTFIEALLRTLEGPVSCMRAMRDESLSRPKERRPASHPEVRRYRAAGADGVAVYSFPSARADADSLYMTDLMQDYSTAVVIEGDCPRDWPDLTVFIAPVPEPESTLLRRGLRHHDAEHAEALAAMERALETPQSLARFLFRGVSEEVLKFALANPESLEKTSESLSESLEKRRAAPPPPPTEHWVIAPPYEGIEWAHLVVVNARNADERKQGGRLVEEVHRLRTDKDVYRDLIGLRGSRVPITAVVADLSDERDPGLKKALARVRRALRTSD